MVVDGFYRSKLGGEIICWHAKESHHFCNCQLKDYGTEAENGNSAEKDDLIAQLREAHALNHEPYQRLKDCPTDESRLATDINRSINRALAILSDVEKSGYTADILNRKSNRAMRAGIVSTDDAEINVAALELSDAMDAYHGCCPICCGEGQIMSIVLEELETIEENTTDFALNFLSAASWSKHDEDMISSQCICIQCALLLDRSIFQENVLAKIPAVSYQGPNRKYIEHQLTSHSLQGSPPGHLESSNYSV